MKILLAFAAAILAGAVAVAYLVSPAAAARTSNDCGPSITHHAVDGSMTSSSTCTHVDGPLSGN